MLESYLAQWGGEIFVAIGSIVTTSIGYLIARDKEKNQFVLAAIKEVYGENNRDHQYLSKRVESLQSQLDSLKLTQLECEKDKGILEAKVEGLKKEIDFLIASFNNPEAIKIFYNLQKKSNGKFFQHANIKEIYEQIESPQSVATAS